MKKFPIIPVIVAVVALAISIVAGRKVESGRATVISNKDRLARVYVPCMGMDKFLADLKWVKLIQDMGKVKGRMNENAAKYFARVLDSITDLDPDFHKAYQMGGMLISNELPQQAIDLLDKGRKYGLKEAWSLPYYSGFFAERFLPRKGEKSKTECLKMAEKYYEEAAQISGRPFYVDHAWMRLATRGAGEDPVAQLAAQRDFVMKLKPSYEGMEGMGEEMYMEGGMEMENSPYMLLSKRLIQRSSSLARKYVEDLDLAKDASYKQRLAGQLDKIRAVFEAFKPAGHTCDNCLNQYGPGQFFCAQCGEKVEAYGYCPGCWSQGKMVITSGNHCHICGGKVPCTKKTKVVAEAPAAK